MLPSNQTVTGLSGLLSQLFGGLTERGALATAQLSEPSAFGQSLAGQIKSLMIERGDDPAAVAAINDEALVAAFLAQAQMPPAPAAMPLATGINIAETSAAISNATDHFQSINITAGDEVDALPTTMLERLGEAGRLLSVERERVPPVVTVQTAPVMGIEPKRETAPAIGSQSTAESIIAVQTIPVVKIESKKETVQIIASEPATKPAIAVQTAPVTKTEPKREVASVITLQPTPEPIVAVQTKPITKIESEQETAKILASQPTAESVLVVQTAPVAGTKPKPGTTQIIASKPTTESVVAVQNTSITKIESEQETAKVIASKSTAEPVVTVQNAPVAEIEPKRKNAPVIAPQPTAEPVVMRASQYAQYLQSRAESGAWRVPLTTAPVEPLREMAVEGNSIQPLKLNSLLQPGGEQHLAEHIQKLIDKGLDRAVIKLEPPSLGALELRLIQADGKHQIQLIAAHPVTRDVLETVQPQLSAALALDGIETLPVASEATTVPSFSAPKIQNSVEPLSFQPTITPLWRSAPENPSLNFNLDRLLQPNGEQNLVQHIRQIVDSGQPRAEIKLDPPNLKTLEVRQTQTNGTPQVQLVASNPVVREALNTALPQIREALAQNGIELKSEPIINQPVNFNHLSQPNGEQNLVQHIRQIIDSGQPRAEIKLDPPNLGTLEIRQIQTNGTPQIQLVASNPVVREALNTALPKIREALAQNGIELKSEPIINQPVNLKRLSQPNGEQNLVQQIRQMIDSGQPRAEIKLDPPNLGTLEIRQTQTNGTPQVQLVASNPVVRETLNTALPKIREALAQNDIEIKSELIINQPVDLNRLSQPNGEQNLVQHIRKIVDSGQLRAEIKLDPPNLGTLEIRQTQTNGTPQVQLVASNSVVRETLNTALPQIREALAQNGIELKSEPIINQPVNFNRLSQPNGEQNLVQQICQMVDYGQPRTEIKLDPPNLGTLEVRQIQTNGTPQVQLVASNPVVREALNTALPQIRKTLAQNGIKLEPTPVINQPVNLNRLLQPNGEQNLVQHIRHIVDSSQPRAEIKLDPANLGSLEVRQTQTNGTPQVQLVASNPVVREALNTALPEIREALAQNGIKLESAPIINQPVNLNRLSQPNGEQSLVRHIRQIIDSSQPRAEIKLDPPNLGTLEVRQTQTNGTPQVQLVASNPVVREALNTALPEIREALAQNGIELKLEPIINQSVNLNRLLQPNGEQNLVQQIRQIVDSGQPRAEIKIDPPNLGTLEVRQIQTNGMLQVQIITPNPIAREILNSVQPQLSTALSQNGVELTISRTDESPASSSEHTNLFETPNESTATSTLTRQALGIAPESTAANGRFQPLNLERLLQPGGEQRLAEQMRWSLERGLESAEIKLHPPSLGALDVRFVQEGDRTHVQFVTAHPVAREALEAALPRLRDALAQDGVWLGNVSVSDQAPNDRGETGRDRREPTWRDDLDADDTEHTGQASAESDANRPRAHRLDVFT